jgi:tetratricopeptide (TPR) repeat protein
MKTDKLLLGLSLVVLISASAASAQEKLGEVHFPVSCSAAAQQEFNRAVALLHSFWFDASAKAFAAVTQLDPGCGMGHWGEAMAILFSPNPFTGTPTPKGLQDGCPAVERAKAATPKTQRERDYIGAVESLCHDRDKADQRTRVVAYGQAMERLSRTYPEDREAAIFYALALNITASPADKTYGNQLKAAEILEKVFAEQPNHPGVAHYLIHSYDYPPIAGRGLSAARRYAGIAPAAPHALHMPSHIFTRRGYWQESIESNRASASAAQNHFDQLHAMDYLAYAYLQMAQDLAAKRVLDEAIAFPKINVENIVPGYALAAIPARYALERSRWADAGSLSLPASDFPWSRFPQAEAVLVFARALGAARSGNAGGARKDMARLEVLRGTLDAAKQSYWAEQVEIQRQVAGAWVARAEGRDQEALQLMRAAADREDATEKHPVTPGPIAPARELLGEMLLELGDPAQALKEFETSHRVEPNRFRGLYGAARAAELSGDPEKARTYYAGLMALCEKADTERPELKEAKVFLARYGVHQVLPPINAHGS